MLARNWWLFTSRGVFGMIFGLIALIFPGPTMLSLVIVFSAYIPVDVVSRSSWRTGEDGKLAMSG
jgi:uncharacterized membrane protein HdeD (DUF308 family)